jgi:DNA-binding transcriptional regulator YbjK
MKASIDLKEDSTEINKKGERYQLMIGGVGYTHGADCGNTAGFGDAKVIGVLDTFTGQLIQVPAETIARAKDVKWIGDTGQLERQQRDLAVESAQRSLSLKSSYACQMGEYTKPENAMRFDTVTTTSWKDLVADSETAVASYSTVLEERKHFIVDLMRNVTRNSSLSESDARVMYDKFLTLFKDYLPNVKNIDSNSSPINKNSLSITYPGNNMNYIHKDNEPQGLYISKEAILILQRMKNAGVNISSIVNSTLSQSVVETYIDAETIGQVKATQLLSKNISAHTDGSPAVNVTPTVTNLYGGILKNILSKLFDTDMTVAKAIETLPIIQAKYPNLISDAELGSIGVATFAMLSYLQVINDKSLMLKFKTLNDLPERISLEQEDYTKNVLDDEGKVTSTEAKKGTAFQFMKVTKNGMIEVVFSPTGQVKSSVYSDGTVRTKTLKSMADNAVESFTDDEFQVSSNSTVQIGAISNFSPQYPRSGAYNVYAGWNVVGEIAKNIVLAMIIGEVTGLLANMAGMKDLYTLYSTTQRSVDIAKAGVNGEMQQLVNNVVGNVVPAGIVNMANGAYGAYKTFETQYNTIKADMDKLVKDSLAGNNTIQQLNQIQSSVNATLQTTQTQLNQLKQDVLNKVGAYEHMTEAELKKASESLMALERQVAYTRYEMEQKLKAMGNKVPGVDIPVQVCLLAEEEIPNICETVKNASGEDIQITMTGSEGLFEINTPNSMLKIRNGFPVAYSNKKSGNVGVFTFNQVISGEKSIEEYLQNVGEMISSEIGETSYFLYDLPGMKIDIKDVIGESVSVSVNSGLSKKTELLYDFNKGTIVTKSYGFSEKEKSGLLGTLKKQLITIIMNKSVKMAKSTKEEWEKINKVIDSSQPRLTSEELTKQLAVMSDWVYFWENDPNKGNREKYAKNLALLKANGWTQYYEEGYDQSMENAVNYDNKTGYHGRILINNNSKQIVFVHRGTEFDRGGLTSVLDIVSDVAILFGMNLQVSSAKKLYEIFFKSNPTYKGYEIIHTGHSLGGAIAQEMAIMYNRNNGDKAVCFAGLGIHDRIKKWEKMNKGKSIDFINNYVVAEDALLWIYPQAGSLFIENKNGSEFGEKSLQQNKINVRSFIINRQDYTSSHSMDYYMDGYHPAENLATYEKLKYYWLAYRTISNYSSIFSRWDMDNITPIGLIRKIGE